MSFSLTLPNNAGFPRVLRFPPALTLNFRPVIGQCLLDGILIDIKIKNLEQKKPHLTTKNMLSADLTDVDQTIDGLWYKTKSGYSVKVGVSGTSRQELRQVLSFGIVSKK